MKTVGRRYLILTAIISMIFIFCSVMHSYAEEIEYTYDEFGNRITKKILVDTTPPVTTASKTTGTYSAPFSVTLTCEDGWGAGCNNIYYTTDGSTPTISSSIYSSPINITQSTVLKYFGVDAGGNQEAVKSQTYTIISGSVTINGGNIYIKQVSSTLTLTCETSGGCSQMQFSNNNSTYSTAEAFASTKAWALTSGNGTKTVYAKFKNTAGVWSGAFTDTIILDGTAPTTTASPVGGTFTGAQTVTLTCADTGGSGCKKIFYTTDGTTPTTSSPVYSAPISVTQTTTLKYFSRDNANNDEAVKTQTYTIINGTVTINGGTAFTNNVSSTLTLTCETSGGCSQMKISNYSNFAISTTYTYAPTQAWSLLTGNGTKTVYVQFKNTAGIWSGTFTDTIVLDGTAPTTTASPVGGTFAVPKTVTLTCADTGGSGCANIYYTTDGSTPTTASSVYSTPISITQTTSLKYFSRDTAGNNEAVKTQTYTIINGTVTINGGTAFTNNVSSTLTLTCETSGGCAQMKISNYSNFAISTTYTYAPTQAWSLLTGNGTKTVYVQFKNTAGIWSGTFTDTIVLDGTAPTTTVSPVGGTYTGSVSVTRTCADTGGSGCKRIFYTTDGTTPTTSSSVFSAPISITQTTTLKYFARDNANNDEAVKTQTYTIQ